MSAIAGISGRGKTEQVKRMLKRMEHRGGPGTEVRVIHEMTLGAAWNQAEEGLKDQFIQTNSFRDYLSDSHYSEARVTLDGSCLERDSIGAAPLYYGWTDEGEFCFASEVKALVGVARNINELEPGHQLVNQEMVKPFAVLKYKGPRKMDPARAAFELRRLIETSVASCVEMGEVGSWLSGGLDSSAIAAIARPHLKTLHTFSAGIEGAADLVHARIMAESLQSKHHEIVVTVSEMLKVLPEVIFHLESFDALLVRSSIMNYLVAKLSADYVPEVVSGEGADELFGGYEYLKSIDTAELSEELFDITKRLHNTALQRVDRCSRGAGIRAHVPLLAPEIVELAMEIPAEYKIRNGVEKWIFREAVTDILPPVITKRVKSKFWEGAGVEEMLQKRAEEIISDQEFWRERELPDGSQLRSKEEYYYYRIFREFFGEMDNLSWMGRTKGSTVSK